LNGENKVGGNTIKSNKFTVSQLNGLFPQHQAGKGKFGNWHGCIEIVECLAAICNVQHFDENGFTHKHDIIERWDALCLDFPEWNRTGEIDKGIRELNPIKIPKDIAIQCEYRLQNINVNAIGRKSVACGKLLPWIVTCLEIQSGHSEDILLMKSLNDFSDEKKEITIETKNDDPTATATATALKNDNDDSSSNNEKGPKDINYSNDGETSQNSPLLNLQLRSWVTDDAQAVTNSDQVSTKEEMQVVPVNEDLEEKKG
jgi:hypothetical protein